MKSKSLIKRNKEIYNKIKGVLSVHDKRVLLLLTFFSVIISIIETIGVSIVMPFIAMATDFSIIKSNKYLNYCYDLFRFTSEQDFIISFGIILVFFFIFRSGINLLYQYYLNRFTETRYQEIAFKLFKSYMCSPYKRFVQSNSSNLTKNIMHESSNFTHLIRSVLMMMSEFFVLVFIYLMLLYVNMKVTLILTLLIVVNAILLTLTVSHRMNKLGDLRASTQTDFYEVLNRNFNNFKLIKLLSNDHKTFNEFDKPSNKLISLNIEASTLAQFPRLFLEAIGFGLITSIVVYLIWSSNGNISAELSTLSIFVLALYRLLPSVNRIMGGYNSVMFSYKALDIIYSDLQLEMETLGNNPLELNKTITLNNIVFGYEENKVILNGINLNIRKGEKIAFVGESGSGKSTLVDIIMGLHLPMRGGIYIDNESLNAGNINSWRKKVGYIPQRIYLFDGTIAENIVFGREYDEEKIINSLKKAHIYDFLILKNGIDTKVGEGGVLLSGGQIQRIAIARAIYGEPEVLVLDEATSALDEKTESQIMQEVYEISKDMTLIIIAHRLSTIENCDEIYRIDNGSVLA